MSEEISKCACRLFLRLHFVHGLQGILAGYKEDGCCKTIYCFDYN